MDQDERIREIACALWGIDPQLRHEDVAPVELDDEEVAALRERWVRTGPSPGTDEADVLPLPRRKPRRLLAGLAGVGVAAALALVVVLSRGVEVSALPEYTGEVHGGEELRRSAASPVEGEVVYVSDTSIRLVLRPVDKHDQAIEAAAVVVGNGTARFLEERLTAKDSKYPGTLALEGKVNALDLEPGKWRVYFIYGRPGALPSEIGEVINADGSLRESGDSWRLVTPQDHEITIRGDE